MTPPTILTSTEIPRDLEEPLAAAYRLHHVSGADVALWPDADFTAVRGWLTSTRQPVTSDMLARLPSLEVISQFGVGFDNIDVPAATCRGVLVCNTPRVLDRAVAELTIGMLVALGRGIVRFDAFVREGTWERRRPELTQGLHGRTLGILGMGRIGRHVARVARALGMDVIYHGGGRDLGPDSADHVAVERADLFRRADFVSIHVPLTPDTRESVGRAELELMKPSAFLINTSRGAVVREQDLVEALRAGEIAGAALDVMSTEPLPAAHPLCAMENVVLLPHIGSATVDTRRAMIELSVRNLTAALEGREPEAVVNTVSTPRPAKP